MEDSDERSPAIGSNLENVVDREVDVANETPDPQRPQLVGQTQLLVDQRFMVDLTKDGNFDQLILLFKFSALLNKNLPQGFLLVIFCLFGGGPRGSTPRVRELRHNIMLGFGKKSSSFSTSNTLKMHVKTVQMLPTGCQVILSFRHRAFDNLPIRNSQPRIFRNNFRASMGLLTTCEAFSTQD